MQITGVDMKTGNVETFELNERARWASYEQIDRDPVSVRVGVDSAWNYLERRANDLWYKWVGSIVDPVLLAFAGGFFCGIVFILLLTEYIQH